MVGVWGIGGSVKKAELADSVKKFSLWKTPCKAHYCWVLWLDFSAFTGII